MILRRWGSRFFSIRNYDIPTTVERTLRVLMNAMSIWSICTVAVVTSDGARAEVVHAAGKKVIGVTVLTSMDDEDLRRWGKSDTRGPSAESGSAGAGGRLDGVVASAQESAFSARNLARIFCW